MVETINIEGVSCQFEPCDTNRVCYLMTPIPVEERKIDIAVSKYKYNMVVLTGMDWNNDLTPWPAPGLVRGSKPFGGLAEAFLGKLTDVVMPDVECRLGLGGAAERTLTGVSLAGLFAAWAWVRCDLFRNIGCISGSFWYDGFAEWLSSADADRAGSCAYFTLGEKESQGGSPRYRTIRTDTERVVAGAEGLGAKTMFELTPGSHFASFLPRLERMLQGLNSLAETVAEE